MNHSELQQKYFDNYKLGVSHCRTLYEKGGVCIFVQESLRYVRIDLEKYCKNEDLTYVPSIFTLMLKVHA